MKKQLPEPFFAFLTCWILLSGCTNGPRVELSPAYYSGQIAGDTFTYTHPPATLECTLNVDSVVHWPLQRSYESFKFAPSKDNTVWLQAYEKSGVLNLQTGVLTPFSERFKHPFFQEKGTRAEVHSDPFDSEKYWFVFPNKGVVQYNNTTGEALTCTTGDNAFGRPGSLLFTKNVVWIGTDNKLWAYKRRTGAVQEIANSPVGIYLILPLPDGKIWVNKNYLYDPATTCWELKSQFVDGSPVDTITRMWYHNGYVFFELEGQRGFKVMRPDGEVLTLRFRGQVVREEWLSPSVNWGEDQAYEPDVVWGNGFYRTDLLDLTSGKVRAYLNTPSVGSRYIFQNQKIAQAPGEVWFLQTHHWFALNKETGNYHVYRSPETDEIVSAHADSKYLYVLTQKQLSIYSKNYLARRFAGDALVFDHIAEARRLLDSVGWERETTVPVERIKALVGLQPAFAQWNDPYIQNLFLQALRHQSVPTEQGIQELLALKDIPKVVVSNSYRRLIDAAAFEGNIAKGYRLMQELYAFDTSLVHNRDYPYYKFKYVDSTFQALRALERQTRLSPDQRLWQQGKIMEQFCIWYEIGGTCYDFSLADAHFKKLVKLYPDSPWADDADFTLIGRGICDEYDGSNDPGLAADWAAFIQKYPGSNLASRALLNQVNALSRSTPDLRKGIRLLRRARDIDPNLFSEQNPEASGLWYLNEFERLLQQQNARLSAALVNDTIRLGEPIQLRLVLTNRGPEPLGLDQPGRLGFAVDIRQEVSDSTCVRPAVQFQHHSDWQQPPRFEHVRSLKQGQSATQIWDLSKLAARPSDGRAGHFEISQPGVYVVSACLNCYEPDVAERSCTVRLVVQ